MGAQSLYPVYDRAMQGQLGKILRGLRVEQGLSFDAIAMKMHAGYGITVDPDTWSRWYSSFVEGASV